MPIQMNPGGWDELLKGIVNDELEPRASAIAAACNRDLDPASGDQGYYAGTEGSDPLTNGDYRATVIAVTNEAKADNARNNTMVHNFHAAESQQ